MLREWVGIEFDEGVTFMVDFIKREMRDIDNSNHVMRYSDMEDKGDCYEFYYDQTKKGIGIPVTPNGEDDPLIYKVRLKQMVRQHPNAVASLYGIPLSEIQHLSDREFFATLPQIRAKLWEAVEKTTDQQLLKSRLEGMLPIYYIGNEKYLVNWEKRRLEHTQYSWRDIDLTRTGVSHDMKAYTCFYNIRDGIPVYDQEASCYDPSMLALLRVQDEACLDPVGVALERGFGPTDLLFAHPLMMEQKAELFLLQERSMSLSQQEQQNKTEKKQVPRRRRGKGI